MEKQQIVKALECCVKTQSICDCEEMGCPALTKQGCQFYLRTDEDYEGVIFVELIKEAISLIRDQEKRIEELENICESYALQYGTATDKEVFLKKKRADTVAKTEYQMILSLLPSMSPQNNFWRKPHERTRRNRGSLWIAARRQASRSSSSSGAT